MALSHTTHLLHEFKILYINLDRNTENKRNIESQLCKLGLCATRISAIDALLFTDEEKEHWLNKKNFNYLSNSPDKVLDCAANYLSHIIALEYALEHNLYPLIILEDNINILANSHASTIPLVIPNECDIFYLGGYYRWTVKAGIQNIHDDVDTNTFRNIQSKLFYDSHIQIVPKFFAIMGNYAYCLMGRLQIYNTLQQIKSHKPNSIDFIFRTIIQADEQCHIANPSLIVPILPTDQSVFYHSTIYNNDNVCEYYTKGYCSLLPRLHKYYVKCKSIPDPRKLFIHLRLISNDKKKS
jgi:hypothetical protein